MFAEKKMKIGKQNVVKVEKTSKRQLNGFLLSQSQSFEAPVFTQSDADLKQWKYKIYSSENKILIRFPNFLRQGSTL